MLLQPSTEHASTTLRKLSKQREFTPCDTAPRVDTNGAAAPPKRDNLQYWTETELANAAVQFYTWKLGKTVPIILTSSLLVKQTGDRLVLARAAIPILAESGIFVTGLPAPEHLGAQVFPSILTIDGGEGLVCLVKCHHAPLFIPEGAMIAQGRVIPKDCPTDHKEP